MKEQTPEQVLREQEITITFLEDVILSLLDPKTINKSWDFPLKAHQYKKEAKKHFLKNTNWTKSFIHQAFKKKKPAP